MSRGGYESHLDFLEEHGCITKEEREKTRAFQKEFEEHPERFRVTTTVTELDQFLMEHGLIRDFTDLRDDIKWYSVSYFIKRGERG